MSTKNTFKVIELATGEQIEHIMDMWRRRLKGRNVTLTEANHIIQNGNLYLPCNGHRPPTFSSTKSVPTRRTLSFAWFATFVAAGLPNRPSMTPAATSTLLTL